MISHEEYGLLKFYLDAGVDETIGLAPVNRFEQAASPPPAARPVELPRKAQKPEQFAPLAESVAQAERAASAAGTIDALKAAIDAFDGCPLKQMATSTVFASGTPGSNLMILDRQPSVDEDRSSLPFSGEAGMLLDRMLAAIGLTRDEVYLASILPWRPPGGRKATKEEMTVCQPFVRRHIELAGPKVIVACGEAAGVLLDQNTSINRLRGKWSDFSAADTVIPTLPMFHPGFLLDHPSAKKYAWADLQAVDAKLRISG